MILLVVFSAMGFVLISGRDRTIDIANTLVEKGQLRVLDADEEETLRRFLSALLSSEKAGVELAINRRYQDGPLNIYVVDAAAREGARVVSRGNAAYVSSPDILFIESSYFKIGDTKVFARSNDSLTEKVLSPLRVQAFFVLAHEIGHRQLQHGREWFGWEGQARSYEREFEADDFAIAALKRLYVSSLSRERAGIPDPIATSFLEEPGPLERIADHLGHAVDFLADEVFDNPFPILANSETHPAFFGRMRSLLQRLTIDAETEKDEPALDRLRLAEAVAAASDYLLSLKPIEIEYSNSFQYAYVTAERLVVIGNDGQPVAETALIDLAPGRQYRKNLPASQREATVRYAWPGVAGETLVLRRNGHLERTDNKSGGSRSTVDLTGKLGDNTCIKQFLLPPNPQFALATSCIEGRPQVSIIAADGSIRTVPLRELAFAASKAAGHSSVITENFEVRGFGLGASGLPVLTYTDGNNVFFAILSASLVSSPARKLTLKPHDLPEPIVYNGARALPGAILADLSGRAYYAYGAPIFRDIGVFDAETISDRPVASVDLSPSVSEDRLNTLLPIASTFPIGQGRLIINLGREGAYLMDFIDKSLLPIRRSGFDALEQVFANGNGDWIYYRKYGNRILVFKGKEHGGS
ncbi:hypothetical protein [Mesorhizobium ventifaucium]|nr:hypothetical protein [Mesorhizobium ventifaucium]